MRHLDELTATLRMTLTFMLALLGIAWGSAKLFTLMGVPVAGSWLFAIFLVTIIGLVLSDKWRKLQKEDEQKSAEPPSTEEPGSVIVDQLETGQLVLARGNDKKAARSFRVPKSEFVSVLDGLPQSLDDDYLIQLVSGRIRCVRRGPRYWREEGDRGGTFFDSDRQVIRYARIDTAKPITDADALPPETVGCPACATESTDDR